MYYRVRTVRNLLSVDLFLECHHNLRLQKKHRKNLQMNHLTMPSCEGMSAEHSGQNDLTLSDVALLAVSPAGHFLPASRNSFDR
jgi:hypothetical protein